MKLVWKSMRIFLWMSTLIFIVGAAWNWENIKMVATYNTILIPPMYGEPVNEAEARAQDLRYLRKFVKIDRSFSDKARQAFLQSVDDLEARIDTMSDADLYLAVSRATALADNGHTNTSDQPLYRRFKTISAKLYWFADGLFIVRADQQHAASVGSRIIAVEGRPVDELAADLSQYRGGNSHRRRVAMPMLIESPEIMHAAGLASSPDSITFSLQAENGELRNVSFEGRLVKNADTLPRRWHWMTLAPEALADEDSSWALVLRADGQETPAYLSKTDQPTYMPLANNGFYIRTKTGFGSETQSVSEFFEQALAGVDEASLDYLVVDFRLNSGGDYTQSMNFAKLAATTVKPGGKLYLAVGPHTFSAAIVTVAMLKYYGGDKSVIIGAPMGDRDQFWAETGMSFALPNSGFHINYATGYHDWNAGCESHPYCYTLNRRYQVPAGSLLPSVLLEPTFADYASGQDIVLDWILSAHAPSN